MEKYTAPRSRKHFFVLGTLLAAFFLFMGTPRAEAGFFSFFENLFSKKIGIVTDGRIDAPALLLVAATNLDPQAGQGGATLSVVDGNSFEPVVGPLGVVGETQYRQGQITLYTVREGDTFGGIAKLFDISVNTILLANNLTRNSLIKPGQTLIILPISGIQYVVEKKDTLLSIAKHFKTDVEELVAFNDLLGEEDLDVGQTLIIPNAEAPLPSAPTPFQSLSKNQAARGIGPEIAGYFLRPLIGGRKSQGLHGYNGVDLTSGCAQPVLASAAGNVIIARSYGWNGGYGSYVVIAHTNGTQTLYGHLRDVLAAPGLYVRQGQEIGAVGTSGRSTGCHLHFEVRGARNPF